LGTSYDPVKSCVTAAQNPAGREINPTTGRPDWGCPQLYANNAPINLNNYDGYGLTAAMGWCASAVGLFAMLVFLHQVLKADMGKPKMIKVSKAIQAGARAFLHREFTFVGIFAVIFFASMCGFLYNAVVPPCNLQIPDQTDCNQFLGTPSLKTLGVFTGLCFLSGGLCSAAAGYLGMWIATRANVRTCWACNDSMNAGLRIAFKSGSVMGLAVVCLGLMGIQICWLILSISTIDQRLVWQYLSGFGFGGSMIALFARVAGGIYTKAADVGADLVGKVEAGIPEDSPNNPAVIADNVGDNVGDVAGMGADLLESYVGALIAACTLGFELYSKLSHTSDYYCCLFGVASPPLYTIPTNYALAAVAYPLWLCGIGILCSIMGIYVVRTNANETMENEKVLVSLLWSIRYGVYFSTILFTGLAALVAWMIMGNSGQEWQCYGAAIIGLFGGNLIAAWTEYCTSYSEYPVKSIAKKSATGPATVIIQGFGVGMLSTSLPLTVLVAQLIACDAIQSSYGIAIAAISMLATLGITLATDAYGPVADNAGGIAEMCSNEVKDTTRAKTDALDSLGNTTAATGKGYAIASAALTSVALIASFVDAAGLSDVNIDDAVVFAGVFIGAMLSFVFAALTMLAVGRAAEDIIFEVRDQFTKEPRLRDGDWEGPEGVPDYERCVTIATNSALMEMVTPSCLAIFSPFIVGYMLGSRCLTGMLVGNVTSGMCMAITMATAGGAWDNAKKYVEKGGLGDAKGKRTSFHAATVVGDTVGDPFKDTSGPSLNIFIKLSALLSIVLAPSFKAINPSGGVFPNSSFWIGIIIFAVVGICLVVYNYFMLQKYTKNAEMLAAARGQDAAGGASPAPRAATPPATTPPAADPPAAAPVQTV